MRLKKRIFRNIFLKMKKSEKEAENHEHGTHLVTHYRPMFECKTNTKIELEKARERVEKNK